MNWRNSDCDMIKIAHQTSLALLNFWDLESSTSSGVLAGAWVKTINRCLCLVLHSSNCLIFRTHKCLLFKHHHRSMAPLSQKNAFFLDPKLTQIMIVFPGNLRSGFRQTDLVTSISADIKLLVLADCPGYWGCPVEAIISDWHWQASEKPVGRKRRERYREK